MIKFKVITIFPELVNCYFSQGIIHRAVEEGTVSVEVVNLRDYTNDKHKTVDDYVFGGGAGMLFKPEPLFKAIDSLKSPNTKTIVLTPRGRKLTNALVEEISRLEDVLIICGRYEGIDHRVEKVADYRVSMGDFVLTGGEIVAVALIDAVSRKVGGVKKESVESESFENGLLEFDQYTRPREFRGMKVPDVLLSGNHKEISQWRLVNSFKNTIIWSPDLLLNRPLSDSDLSALKSAIYEIGSDDNDGGER